MKEHECKGCRERKILVYHLRGLGYCENCKHKAPSKRAFEEYMYPREREFFVEHKRKARFSTGNTMEKD